jgi:GNAT superfamily N-acetyltransferase
VTYHLRKVETPGDWAAMHAIRRATLFAPGRHSDTIVYDEYHPDDRRPTNQCFVLVEDETPIGVVRLDTRGDSGGVVRLVAIAPHRQRQGLGTIMSRLVEEEAKARGMRSLFVNAYGLAVGFYRKTGWREDAWDPAELVGIAVACVQMSKPL